MTIKKYPQSCIMIDTNDTKILVDPGNVLYTQDIQREWNSADYILVTHFHPDHCFCDAIKSIGKPIYSTSEVQDKYNDIVVNIVKAGQILSLGGVRVEVVLAKHGYIGKELEVKQNVGYIIDDGNTSVYITSDCIRFEHSYKADIMLANVCAFDASMNLWGAVETAKDIGAKKLVVMHQDAGRMFYPKEQIKKFLDTQGIDYIIPNIGDVIRV